GDIIISLSIIGNHEVFFIPRHGEQGNLPPHRVNHLGNIQALAVCHVKNVFSIGTVGSMKKTLRPGDLILPNDFIDMTKSRPMTFFNDQRVHVDMTEPFCPSLRNLFITSSKKYKDVTLHEHGVYLATEGPRLETAAEITLYSQVADIVGMTLVPEVILAREKGMCFASLCLICNMAAGLQERLPADEIASIYKEKEPAISRILQQTILSFDQKKPCDCPSDVSKASL
ncbi:MAG: MTAP family purine nucleoside phosphorylase, partial [Candidatus Thermoplasmatota archaeon]|nr:MTAP family purine nucleoside phosphorylase [Candidatus Thermoplasmatota archaeon]